MSTTKPTNWNPILLVLTAGAIAVLLSVFGSLACGQQPYPAAPVPASITPTASQAGPVCVLAPRRQWLRRTLGMAPAYDALPLYQKTWQPVMTPVWQPVTMGGP